MSKSGGLWFLALSFALSIILRVPLLFQYPFTFVDEAWVASTAKVLVEGGKLYLDVWCNKQPLLLFFSEFLFQVFGLHMEAIHLAALFLVFLVSTLLFCIGSSFFSPAVGGGAALTYALLSTTYYTPRIIGTTTEGLMLVFTCAAIYCFLQGRVKARVYCFFGAGLLSFLAVISKPAAVTQIALFFILLLPRRSQAKGLQLKSLALLGAGYLCGLSLLVLYLANAGSLEPWWYQSLISRVEYVSQITLPDFLSKLIRQPFTFGLITSWIWLLSWGGASREGTKPDCLLGDPELAGQRFHRRFNGQTILCELLHSDVPGYVTAGGGRLHPPLANASKAAQQDLSLHQWRLILVTLPVVSSACPGPLVFLCRSTSPQSDPAVGHVCGESPGRGSIQLHKIPDAVGR